MMVLAHYKKSQTLHRFNFNFKYKTQTCLIKQLKQYYSIKYLTTLIVFARLDPRIDVLLFL